jgi:hypothetical protein
MDEQGLIKLLRGLISDIEGAPSPGVIKGELYSIWYEHAQTVAQEALEYLNTNDPGHNHEDSGPIEFE